MEISANAEKIISQANQWTFAVDCALLQWMEEIGKNLEQRATETNKHFDELSTNLKQTGTALDNVTNSLAALQYTQFVESRCHDDDETIANVTDVPLDIPNQNDQTKDSDDVWQNFLKNNLEALRSCHERYSLDLEDSDEEEATNNFIYQPKNPYNERILPHIYGSKLWNENWHVGLCDDSNSFSGDDISESFSETSSSPAEDNDSFASNSANLPEWASTTSMTKEKSHQQQPIRIQNASSLRGSQTLFPSAQDSFPNASSIAGSETSSPASKTAQIVLKQHQPRFDIFAPVQDSSPPPLSSSSSASSLQQQQVKNDTQSKNNIRTDSANLVTKPATVNTDIISPSYISPIKRRPVNLFDDDDFTSFLTEKVNKSTSREAPISRNNTTMSTTGLREAQKGQEKIHPSMTPNTQPIIINSQTNKKPPTLNLFDSPESSPKNEDSFNKVQEVVESREENIVRPKLSTKTLFDDDDDDDDFLAFFTAKKENTPKPVTKLKLFDDDIEDAILQSSRNVVVPPIDKITKMQAPKEEKDLSKNSQSIKRKDSPTIKQNLFTEVTDKKYISEEQKDEGLFKNRNQNPVNVFDDINVRVDESATKGSTPAFQKKTDIFSSEEDNDLFKATFVQTDKISSKIFEENVRDTKQINTELPQIDQKQNENIEPIRNVPIKQPEITQGFSGNSGDGLQQKNKTSDQIRAELVNKNDELIQSNETALPEEVLTVHKQSLAPTDKQEFKNTFSDLVLDEPPDDNSAFLQTLNSNAFPGSGLATNDFEEDNYEPALPSVPTADRTATQKVIPTISYSNLGLFSDVPPDDDLEDSSIESANTSNNEPKRIHSIFYDDFNETMEALNNRKSLETNPSLHSIFYDEPPPDDDFQALLENKFNEANNTPMDKFIDNIQTHETKQESDKPCESDETIIPPPKSVIVSKLKRPNININVQALLPAATQKSQLRKSVEKDKKVESTSILEQRSTSPVIAPQTELERDSAENILVNVCKHRVRAPAQRRPSTRRGRQENYRKSLISEQEDELNIEKENKQEIKAIAKSTQKEDKELTKTAVQSIKEVTKDIPRTNQTISSASTLTPGALKSVPSKSTQNSVLDLFDEDNEKKQELDVKNMQAAVTKNKSDVLFDDDNDGDNDDYAFLFGDINKNKKIEEFSKPKTAYFLPQVNEGDDIAIQKNLPSDNSQIQTCIPNPKTSGVKPETPEFDDVSKLNNKLNESAVSRNKVFEAIDNQAAHKEYAAKIIVIDTLSGAGGLFDDDDEDVDFLLANKISSIGGILIDSSKTNKQTKLDDSNRKKVQNSPSDIEIENKSANNPTPATLVRDGKKFDKKDPSLNIFGDDDDDDDILFGSSTSKSQPQAVVINASSEAVAGILVEQKFTDFKKKSEKNLNKLVTQPKVSSLFGSDEDDQNDEGKFLNAIKNPAKLKTRLTKAAEKEDSNALFSDTDDDDEDLFGSKTTKATLPKISQSHDTTATKKQLLQTNKTTPSAATTTDNPLADLFND